MSFKEDENFKDDDCCHEPLEEQEAILLIKDLFEYTEKLERMVVELRVRINRLEADKKRLPFPDIHENIYESFCDYPAYQRFREYFEDWL